MSIRDEATKLHDSGHNCAQSVFTSCREHTGLDDKLALAISGGFGGGLRVGEVCGALSGALMAIGVCNPYDDCTDTEKKEKIAALAKEVCRRFKEKYGCLRCNDLKAIEVNCGELIEFTAELAETIIKENK